MAGTKLHLMAAVSGAVLAVGPLRLRSANDRDAGVAAVATGWRSADHEVRACL